MEPTPLGKYERPFRGKNWFWKDAPALDSQGKNCSWTLVHEIFKICGHMYASL